MKLKPKISIIVPVYNVATYLRRCLDSCIYQSMQEIEIVIVNDMSPDKSDKAIIQEYAINYPNKVNAIEHKKNLGLGEARNTGIKVAKGEFLMFCDSDDFLDFTACEKMYSSACQNSSDLVVCDYYYMRDGMLGKRTVNGGIDTAERNCRPFMIDKTTVWVMMVKRSLIVDNDLFSPFRFAEDNITVLWYLAANKISKINMPLYYYVYRPSSLIGNMPGESAIHMVDVYLKVLNNEYFITQSHTVKVSVQFLILRRILAFWIEALINSQNADFKTLLNKILEIVNATQDYSKSITTFCKLKWEVERIDKICRFASTNILDVNFNERFLNFYFQLDLELTKPVLENLNKLLQSKRIVFWAAGRYARTLFVCLRNAGFDFETTDIVIKKAEYKTWNELSRNADIVFVASSEFVNAVRDIVGDTEIFDLQKYLNENLY